MILENQVQIIQLDTSYNPESVLLAEAKHLYLADPEWRSVLWRSSMAPDPVNEVHIIYGTASS